MTHVAKSNTTLDPITFRQEVDRETTLILDHMEKHWGTRPSVSFAVETTIAVTADFNIKGFAHKGRRVTVTPQNKRTPKRVARIILGELADHRNTCKECGIQAPAIWERLSHARAILTARRETLEPPYGLLSDGKYQYYLSNGKRASLPLIPLDPVEAALFPSRARIINQAIKSLANRKKPKPTSRQMPSFTLPWEVSA